MNRLEVLQFLKTFFADLKNTEPDGSRRKIQAAALKPFLETVLSLKQDLPIKIPLLRDLAVLETEKDASGKTAAGILRKRIDRRYSRLCRVQEELGRLDFKKAAPGISPEDYVFSRIDFSRYRKMDKEDFEKLVPEGLEDFSEDFFRKNFGIGRAEIRSVIERSYKKSEEVYKIQKENPLILSLMRTLETSLESSPLFTGDEIQAETLQLLAFVSGGTNREKNIELLYPLLVHRLDNVIIHHEDGMQTKLFISPQGDLSGTFRPGDKPWTLVLIPVGESDTQFE